MIYVVRHARARSRSDWHGPDHERPLNDRGHRQAERLAERLSSDGAAAVMSSPYRRCVETVGPLAARLGVAVEENEDLAEGAGGSRAAQLVFESPEGTVICSHGDVLYELVVRLTAGGAPLDMQTPFAKGAVLRLERHEGRVVGAQYEGPPK